MEKSITGKDRSSAGMPRWVLVLLLLLVLLVAGFVADRWRGKWALDDANPPALAVMQPAPHAQG